MGHFPTLTINQADKIGIFLRPILFFVMLSMGVAVCICKLAQCPHELGEGGSPTKAGAIHSCNSPDMGAENRI